MPEDDPVMHIGDTFRMAIQLPQPSDVDSGLRSPLMRVRDIRRDDAGVVELLVVPIAEEPPV